MRRTTISHFSFLISSRLSNVIKGRAAPWSNSESHISLLTTCPSSVYNPIIRNKRWWRRVLESFSERQRSVWAANGTRTFHFGDKDEESFGICPLQQTKDGRKAIWVVSRVLSSLWGWRAFFIIRILTDAPVKLGGTARKEKLVPWDVFSFCVF